MKISLGSMRDRLTIQEAVIVNDGGGGQQTTWQDIANYPNIFVELIGLKIVERVEFSQLSHKATHKIIMRYHADMTLDKQLTDGVNNFAIERIEDVDARNKFLVCYLLKL